jgi:hypothetical protein
MRSDRGRGHRPKHCSMLTDTLGNPVSLQDESSLAGLNDFPMNSARRFPA